MVSLPSSAPKALINIEVVVDVIVESSKNKCIQGSQCRCWKDNIIEEANVTSICDDWTDGNDNVPCLARHTEHTPPGHQQQWLTLRHFEAIHLPRDNLPPCESIEGIIEQVVEGDAYVGVVVWARNERKVLLVSSRKTLL